MAAAAAKFDPTRSKVSEDSLAKFLAEPLSDDLTTVPGIGPVGAANLAKHGCCTTRQLVGRFLVMKTPAMTPKEHLDAFWTWLGECGVGSHRSGVVVAVSERVALAFP